MSKTPSLVVNAFARPTSLPSVDLRTILLLERLGCRYVIAGNAPGFRDALILWCVLYDWAGISSAADVERYLDEASESLSAPALLAAIPELSQALEAALAPAFSPGSADDGSEFGAPGKDPASAGGSRSSS